MIRPVDSDQWKLDSYLDRVGVGVVQEPDAAGDDPASVAAVEVAARLVAQAGLTMSDTVLAVMSTRVRMRP